MPISTEDQDFIEELLTDELQFELLEKLDEKIKNQEFRLVYEEAIAKKYSSKKGKLKGYLPMIILVALILLGIYLILVSP